MMKIRILIIFVFLYHSKNILLGQTREFTLCGKITDSLSPEFKNTNCKIYIYSDSNIVNIVRTNFEGKYQCSQLNPSLSKSLNIKLKYFDKNGIARVIDVPINHLDVIKKQILSDVNVEFNYDISDTLITKNNFLAKESSNTTKINSINNYKLTSKKITKDSIDVKVLFVYSTSDTLHKSIKSVRIYENKQLLTTIYPANKNIFNIKLSKKIKFKNLHIKLEHNFLDNLENTPFEYLKNDICNVTDIEFKIVKRKFKKCYIILLNLSQNDIIQLKGQDGSGNSIINKDLYLKKGTMQDNIKEKIILKAPENNTPANLESKPIDSNLQNR